MTNQFTTSLISLTAIVIGGVIGLLFGTIQNIASARNRKRQESGQLKNGWVIMPGSFGRIAILLITLVVVQVACPIFFEGNIQWLVSVGVILGYGWTLLKQLRQQHFINHA
jgi:putative copper export protein